jgi:hypothetical protein
MDTLPNNTKIGYKIARLVEEKGWNHADFVRATDLNRHTVREILQHGDEKRLRNATIAVCAEALGLQVSELQNLPLEQLLRRVRGQSLVENTTLESLLDRVTQPELKQWIERNTERSQQLTPDEITEILMIQSPEGPLARIGVEQFVSLIERRRKLIDKVKRIASTEHLGLLEQIVDLIYEKTRS